MILFANYHFPLTLLAIFLAAAVVYLARRIKAKQDIVFDLTSKLDDALRKRESLTENNAVLQATQANSEDLVSSLRARLIESTEQIALSAREIQQTEQQKNTLEALATRGAEDILSLRQELEQKTFEISELRRLLVASEVSDQELREQLARFREALAEKESERIFISSVSEQNLEQLAKAREALAKKEEELSVTRTEADQYQDQLARTRENLNQTEIDLAAERTELTRLQEHVNAAERLDLIQGRLAAFEDQHELISVGLYPISLDFGTPDELRNRLEVIRSELAEMVRNKTAAICTTKWTINGSAAEGAKATRHYVRIMLRTFNADADACLDLVRWNNLDKCESRLRASFEYVNDLGSSHSTYLQEPYLELRISQLKLMHKYRESLHLQRESLRAAKRAAIEERRANREIEKARLDAEAEERRYSKALDRARQDIQALVGYEREQMRQTILELEARVAQAALLKQRAISMAQITKAGFVYVVSNIGSFGADVLKIGMTRRIDPQERVRELGGASVPFHFDVHAMIYSENAPELENTFHRRFSRLRLNLANGRKEFFRVALDEVVEYAKELKLDAEFSSHAEARDFHISNQIRSTLTEDEIMSRLELLTAHDSNEYAETDEDDFDSE